MSYLFTEKKVDELKAAIAEVNAALPAGTSFDCFLSATDYSGQEVNSYADAKSICIEVSATAWDAKKALMDFLVSFGVPFSAVQYSGDDNETGGKVYGACYELVKSGTKCDKLPATMLVLLDDATITEIEGADNASYLVAERLSDATGYLVAGSSIKHICGGLYKATSIVWETDNNNYCN